ncbi:hypothetical protein ACQCT3_00885 [Sutcliffiella horikoshii]|uniref:hypothetical protein n=1 Tax=Sutcliffiella horikoshii TaxID=79883 RepID=UPI003CEF2D2D
MRNLHLVHLIRHIQSGLVDLHTTIQTKEVTPAEVEAVLKDIIVTIDINNPSYDFEEETK